MKIEELQLLLNWFESLEDGPKSLNKEGLDLYQKILTEIKERSEWGTDSLQQWFGLSYAAFLVMPRVAMQLMPEDWQESMAVLLHQYNNTINTSAFAVQGCTVRTTGENGKLIKTPDELLNYRHPSSETKAELLKK